MVKTVVAIVETPLSASGCINESYSRKTIIVYYEKEVLETLKELKGVHPFKILAKNAYDERDQKATQKRQTKAKNQKKRKRQADKQAHAAGKKAAKKAYEDAVMKHLSPEHV